MIDRLFHKVEGAHVILRNGGVYRQADLYRRFDGEQHQAYARTGTGFVRLLSNRGTTNPNTSWLDIHAAPGTIDFGFLGAPVVRLDSEPDGA